MHYTTLLHHTTKTTATALANTLITLHYSYSSTTLHYNYRCNCKYNYNCTTLHHTTSSSCGKVTTATIATIPKNTTPTTCVHQRIRSAIRDSQQPIAPIGFLFLKLPPPPCAVLVVTIPVTNHLRHHITPSPLLKLAMMLVTVYICLLYLSHNNNIVP